MKAVKVSLLGLLLIALIGILLSVGSVSYSNEQLTGDQILRRADDQQELITKGDLITFIRFDNVYSDGTTAYNIFAGLSKQVEGQPDRSLIYFKEPEDVRGTIFLSIKPRGEEARMWLYLPALGAVKEIVSQEKHKSFAGSTFSYREVGSRRMSDDYNAKLLGEESVTIGDKSYDCYVLQLTAKPDADVEYPTAKAWIDKQNWLTLKSEDYNEAGNLERTMEVLELGQFEDHVVVNKLIAKNILKNSSTTITFLKRERPDKPIPDSVFDPDNLPEFDPTEWGLDS